MKFLFSSILLLYAGVHLYGQIVTLDPAFPERNELVTITYDASQGSQGLLGESQVYMHTGLITSNSTSGSDWKYTIGNWGTDDPRVKMTAVGDNKHTLSFVIDDFYGVPTSELIEQLAFVFRNQDGSKEGKTASGGDIFVEYNEVSQGFVVRFETPVEDNTFAEVGETVAIKVVSSNPETDIDLFINNEKVAEVEASASLEYDFLINQVGEFAVSFRANSPEGLFLDNILIVSNPQPSVVELPMGSQPGITRLDNNTIRCVLIAPGKLNAYVLGTWNSWTPSGENFMNITPDGKYFWKDIAGVPATEDHALMYQIDGDILTADPFSEMVFDTWNDPGIPEAVFPNLPQLEIPSDGYATWLRPDDGFEFQFDNPQIAAEDLVIYEVLIRDFDTDHSYQNMLDRLDYLSDLGINAIEFMPINEFEGNESWGYNPSFHMALDKYYGTPEKFKAFVDACHERGIVVLLDVVYNHAFSQSPFAQMWWDQAAFQPTEDNPFLNVEAKHPFNVGYDFDHESEVTKEFVKRVTAYWIEEYNIDGYRFDLSKGFTQRDANGNVGAWGNYDASRIAILKEYASHIWSVDPDSKIILEHFGDNQEEKELSDFGMMLWSNQGHTINNATMGFNNNSNFDWIDYMKRDWNSPLAVNYMESHDEERLMYKNLNFGSENSQYSVKVLNNALIRNEAASAMFYMFPGPKMLWQFGEMGYDYSINRCENGSISDNCRLSPKPIRWDYLDDPNRQRLVDVTSAIIKLKTDFDIAKDVDYTYNLNGDVKVYRFEKEDLQGLVIANFGIESTAKVPVFPKVGTYYDYLSGDVLEVTSIFQELSLAPGQYHIYLDKQIGEPVIVSSIDDPQRLVTSFTVYPNPTQTDINVSLEIKESQLANLSLYDALGRKVFVKSDNLLFGQNTLSISTEQLKNGMYFIKIEGQQFTVTESVMVKK